MGRRKITIDRLELLRLRIERNLAHSSFPGVSKRTYNDIENKGTATEHMLRAIAKRLALPNGEADLLPVDISPAKVRDLRLGLGLTPAELANRCPPGYVPTGSYAIKAQSIFAETIRRIEEGQPTNDDPVTGSRDLWRRLAAALNCRPNDLIESSTIASPQQAITELLGIVSESWIERILSLQDKTSGGITAGTKGGATQAWTTAQMLVGIFRTPGMSRRYSVELRQAFVYLDRSRRPHGYAPADLRPEQEQGWSLYDQEETPVTEITCWVLLAYFYALATEGFWPEDVRHRVRNGLVAGLPSLLHRQCISSEKSATGGFCPTVHVCKQNQRTYSTVMAVWALLELLPVLRDHMPHSTFNDGLDAIDRATKWLIKTRDSEYGWIPKPFYGMRARYLGLTAQVLYTLTLFQRVFPDLKHPIGFVPALHDFLAEAERFFSDWEFGSWHANMNINLGDVWLEGTGYRLEPSAFFWGPWSLALLMLLINDPPNDRVARHPLPVLRDRVVVATHKALTDPGWGGSTALIGETLFALSHLRPHA